MLIIKNLTMTSTTLLKLCHDNEIFLPNFCYHDMLSIAGNCRMCLISGTLNIIGRKVLLLSCSLILLKSEEVTVELESRETKNARIGVLQLLLLNHPLDCPICDEGGECDLQDISYSYGLDKGLGNIIKRSNSEILNIGPFIRTLLTRCIHCTRCLRFLEEYENSMLLGLVGRGMLSEITTYNYYSNSLLLKSELSANIVDLCPVSSLKEKQEEFSILSFEKKKELFVKRTYNSLIFYMREIIHKSIILFLRKEDLLKEVSTNILLTDEVYAQLELAMHLEKENFAYVKEVMSLPSNFRYFERYHWFCTRADSLAYALAKELQSMLLYAFYDKKIELKADLLKIDKVTREEIILNWLYLTVKSVVVSNYLSFLKKNTLKISLYDVRKEDSLYKKLIGLWKKG